MKEKGCAKKFAKRGFIDAQEVEHMFARVKPENDIKAKQTSQWIQLIQKQFQLKVDQPPVQFEEMMNEIKEAVKSEVFN